MPARRVAGLLLLALVFAAGCTSSGVPVDPSPPPAPPPGAIRFGYPQEPPTLDPLAAGGGAASTRDILRPVLPALFALDEEMRPVPELVEAWPSRSDVQLEPLNVRLRLRDARWSDGKAITAEDVRFTWGKLREGPTGARYRHLTDVQVLGPRELILRFDAPVRRWWALFSIDDMVLPAHAYSAAWANGPTVSGGPFAVAGWQRGLQIQLRRNARYWGEPAMAETIEVVFVPDDQTRFELLDRERLHGFFAEGDANVGNRAAARDLEPADEALDGGGGASGAWGSTWWELVLHPDLPRTRPSVAQALVAVDRSLVAEILEDSGQVMDGVPARFPVPGARSDGRPAIEGPWAEVRRPGRASGEVRLAYVRGAAPEALGRFFHFALRPAGVRVENLGIEPRSFHRTWLPERRADASIVLRRGVDAPDLSVYRGRGADDALDAAEIARDPDRLASGPVAGVDRARWADAQRELVTAFAPLARVRTWIVARPGLAGPRALGTAAGPLWNAAQWTLRRVA